MKGIMFSEPMFNAVIEGNKTMTRRILNPQPYGFENGYPFYKYSRITDERVRCKLIRPRYKVGETVYLKEPYYKHPCFETEYKYGFKGCGAFNIEKWSNKLFMPEEYARYFIEITGSLCEQLQDISDEDCLKEGVVREYMGDLFTNKLTAKTRKEHWEEHFGKMIKLDNNNSRNYLGYKTPQKAFAALIDKINGKGTWDSNPYVFAYDFKLLNNK